jgi:endogenous inhibitor of DNA gyrase (YacG/DUF329 family)
MERASICPTCKRNAKPYAENPAHPFCSSRCKLADLSNWFNESYSLPADDERPSDDSSESDGGRTLN